MFLKEGLWWAYNGARQFERLVRKHLTFFLRRWTADKGADVRRDNASVSDSGLLEPSGYELLPLMRDQIEKIVKAIVEPGLKRRE